MSEGTFKKLPGWEAALSGYLSEAVKRPYGWGENDCALFAAGAVLAMTGRDPAAHLRGYTDKAGALRVIRENGGSLESLMESVAESAGLREVTFQVGHHDNGTVVLVSDTAHGGALGVMNGGKIVFPGPGGVFVLSPKSGDRFWQVEGPRPSGRTQVRSAGSSARTSLALAGPSDTYFCDQHPVALKQGEPWPPRGEVIVGIGATIFGYSATGAAATAASLAINVAIAVGSTVLSSRRAKKAKEEAARRAQAARRAAAEAARRAAELAKKQRFQVFGDEGAFSGQVNQPITVTVTDAVAPRRILYGRSRIGGVRVFAQTHNNNQTLTQFLALCDGPVDGLEKLYFDDEEVPLTRVSGDEYHDVYNLGGRFTGRGVLWFHYGKEDQPANAGQVGQLTNWTDDHKLTGVCYAVLDLVYDLDVYSNGIPSPSFQMRGRNDVVLDPETGETGWTDNAALCYAHYLQQDWRGLGIPTTEIGEEELAAAAAVCGELVPLAEGWGSADTVRFDADGWIADDATPLVVGDLVRFEAGGGTLPPEISENLTYEVSEKEPARFRVRLTSGGSHVVATPNATFPNKLTGGEERRYSVGGAVLMTDNPESVMEQFESAMAGGAVPVGGSWRIYAGRFLQPTFEITEDMLRGPVSYSTRGGRRNRANVVKGVYAAKEFRFEKTDYPARTDPDYVVEDGARSVRDLNLPLVSSGTQAQRLANIELERARLEESLTLVCSLEAMPAMAGSGVLVTFPALEMQQSVFFVESFKLAVAPGGAPGVQLELTRIAPEVFDWITTDEIPVADPPPVQTGKPRVSAVEADPAPGVYLTTDYPLSVELSTATEGATIRWSRASIPDGPGDGTAYNDTPINIDLDDALFARAFKTGYLDSSPLLGGWTAEQVEDVLASPPGGAYPSGNYPFDVTLSTVTSGATIRWSKSAAPATSSEGSAYAGPVSVSSGETLYARAFKAGLVDSEALEAAFTSS